MIRIAFPTLMLGLLAACGSGDPQGKSTTKLDAVEVQPGTISDSMIILDDSNVDGTAVDDRVPDDVTASGDKEKEEDSTATEKEPDTEDGGEARTNDPPPTPAKVDDEEN